MEIGLPQDDAARRGISLYQKILCVEELYLADHELQYLRETTF